jgi:hypothetical protein
LGLLLSLVRGFLGVPLSLETNLVPFLQGELTDVHLYLNLLLLTLVRAQESTLQVSLNTSLLGIFLLNWAEDLPTINVLATCLEMRI